MYISPCSEVNFKLVSNVSSPDVQTTKWALARMRIPSGYMPSFLASQLSCVCSLTNDLQFLSIRKMLEANMPLHSLYPPGRILWAVRNSDVSYAAPPPVEQRYSPMEALCAQQREEDGTCLFEVLGVQEVFMQIIFSHDMIRYESHVSMGNTRVNIDMELHSGSSHMAHTYNKVIEVLQ